MTAIYQADPSLLGQLVKLLTSSRTSVDSQVSELAALVGAPWGDGSDGDLSVVGAEVLFNERYYDTVSFGPAGVLETASLVLRCLTLDLRGAQAGAIVVSSTDLDGGNGGLGAGLAGSPPALSEGTLGGGGAGAAGGAPGADGANADAGDTPAAGGTCGNGGDGVIWIAAQTILLDATTAAGAIRVLGGSGGGGGAAGAGADGAGGGGGG